MMWPEYCDPDVLGLDGDAAFAFDVHRVEVLGAHEARVDGAGDLEDAVRQRGLAVIDVRDDADGPDFAGINGRRRSCHGPSRLSASLRELSRRLEVRLLILQARRSILPRTENEEFRGKHQEPDQAQQAEHRRARP